MKLSEGTLLGGRVTYAQPEDGYRTGIEPVLLAAAVPARPGERVLEAGTGAGAGLLALAARVDRLALTGVERDPAMAAVATANFVANGLAGAGIHVADITAWDDGAIYDHAFANPPWHASDGTASPRPARRDAKVAAPGELARWACALGAKLRRRGTLSLVLPASAIGEAAAALDAACCPEWSLLPLWPRMGCPARLIIVSGVRLGRGGSRVLPGLVLHEADGGYTKLASAILKDGQSLCLYNAPSR